MDIKRIPSSADQKPAEKTQEIDSKTLEHKKTNTNDNASTPKASDRVQISKEYQEISTVKRVSMELSDIRSERVEQLREMIENGTYVVNPKEIANKMLDEVL